MYPDLLLAHIACSESPINYLFVCNQNHIKGNVQFGLFLSYIWDNWRKSTLADTVDLLFLLPLCKTETPSKDLEHPACLSSMGREALSAAGQGKQLQNCKMSSQGLEDTLL